jgi:hypothetical protein
MVIGRGWFGALYAVFFTLWGVYRIVDQPHGINLVLGVLLLVVGLASGLMWLRNWQKAQKGG